jgi:peptidyl-prolyl cis-trans isomerase B (cyclophilin B)
MSRRVALVGVMGLMLGLSLAGCGKKEAPSEAAAPAVKAEAPAESARDLNDPLFQQPFAEATLAEPPSDTERPPETTVTGKSVGKLYTQISKEYWPKIRFVSASGKKLNHSATIETDVGNIVIELWPDAAPNHVRNFVALALAGYYDGLVFERTIHQDVEGSDMKREMIEAGCPLGTGEAGYGSIGYWLKPELTDKMVHDEGVVGSCHGDEEDGGACRFYINLAKAPYLDGQYTIFGRVTQGLDVARQILTLPARNDAEYPEGDRPVKPVVMKRVTIQVTEPEAVAAQ